MLKLKTSRRYDLWLFVIIRLLLLGAIISSIWKNDWRNLILLVITLILTFMPSLIEKSFKLSYPNDIQIAILMFIYASIYLGQVKEFYHVFWWWDIWLHMVSGIIIGLIGFYTVYLLNSEKKIAVRLSPATVAIFSFCFAMALGVVWEIFEFMMDFFFGTNMQRGSLPDTMSDLIVDFFGALGVSIWGYVRLKAGDFYLMEKFHTSYSKKMRDKSKKMQDKSENMQDK